MNRDQTKFNFIDHIFVLFQWRKLIIINFLAVAILSAAVSLIVPLSFKAHTTILPPVEDERGFGISSLLGNLPIANLAGMGMMTGETHNILAILNSRQIMTSVAQEFNLMDRYNHDNMEKTIKTLRKHIKISVNDDGTISASTEASTPYFSSAADVEEARILSMNMANFLISELDRLNKILKTEKASNTRQFIESRYLENLTDLAKAEMNLKSFQEQKGTFSFPEQTSATIGAIAQIQAQIIAKKVEIESIIKTMGSNHSLVIQSRHEHQALTQQLKNMIRTQNALPDKYTDVFLPLDDIPAIGLEYARLLREVMIQQKIMEFLLPQYEQAKIQEAKDTPTIQVLDEAVPPVKRAKPKRAVFVIFWSFLSLLVSMSIIFVIEKISDLKTSDPVHYKKIESIYINLKNDFKKKK